MLRRIRQGLRGDVVCGDLDRLREPRVRRDVELDRDRRAARERSQRRAETTPGKDRGVDPTRELLQLRDRIGQSRGDAGQLALKVALSGGTSASAARTASPSETSRCWVPSWR